MKQLFDSKRQSSCIESGVLWKKLGCSTKSTASCGPDLRKFSVLEKRLRTSGDSCSKHIVSSKKTLRNTATCKLLLYTSLLLKSTIFTLCYLQDGFSISHHCPRSTSWRGPLIHHSSIYCVSCPFCSLGAWIDLAISFQKKLVGVLSGWRHGIYRLTLV